MDKIHCHKGDVSMSSDLQLLYSIYSGLRVVAISPHPSLP